MADSDMLGWAHKPSAMLSSLTSYDVGRSLLQFVVDGAENVAQSLGLSLCLRQLLLTRRNTNSKVNGSFTSHGPGVVGNIQLQTSTATHVCIDSNGDGIDSIHPTSKAAPGDIDIIQLYHRQLW